MPSLGSEVSNLASALNCDVGADCVSQDARHRGKISCFSQGYYRKTADAFRFPYWDWHRPRGVGSTASGISGIKTKIYDFGAPRIFTDQQIMVKKPSDNELSPMENPFAFYAFPKENDGGMNAEDFGVNSDLARYSKVETQRHPDGPAHQDTLNEALKKIRDPEVRNIVNMIVDPHMGYGTFEAFGWNGETAGPSGSLEGSEYHNFLIRLHPSSRYSF